MEGWKDLFLFVFISGVVAAMGEYGIEQRGRKYTEAFRAYVTREGQVVSPFHDVPAYPDPSDRRIVNVVNEIERFSNAKMEINKGLRGNPITQDIKQERVRYVHNVYPFKGYMWNYGAVPQTWEDKDKKDKLAGVYGDNDPIDVIEIGEGRKELGEVYQGKILGCIALVDGGECDWKIVVIDVRDPQAPSLNGIGDVASKFPGLLDDTREWFRNYKYPMNQKRNEFALDGEYRDHDVAAEVVYGTHLHWQRLMENESYEGISLVNATLENTKAFSPGGIEAEGEAFSDGTEPPETGTYFFMPENV